MEAVCPSAPVVRDHYIYYVKNIRLEYKKAQAMNFGQSPEKSSPEFSNKIQEDVLYLYQHAIPVDYTLLTFPL